MRNLSAARLPGHLAGAAAIAYAAPMAGKARILIADDHVLVRRGVRATLSDDERWSVVGEAENGQQAVELAATLHPDLVVLDVTMPLMNGVDAARAMLAADPGLKVLVLTVHDGEQLVRDLLEAGVKGYLLKSDAGDELVAAVASLLAGRTHFTTRIAQIVLAGFLRERRATGEEAVAAALSPQERRVLQLLAEGHHNRDIAERLGISVKTAETHRAHIMRKMGFTSLSDLVRYAIRNGMVPA